MKKIFRKNNKLTFILRSEASSGSYQPLDITQNRSDSEHTQSSQTHNDERFRMTENCHTKAFSVRHSERSEESTVDIQRDSCLRCRRGTSRTYQDARRVRSYSFPQNDGESNKINCHPGGFTDGRRVNESEPSPVSEQIEHTKTESLYAKLCEREVNPRQLVSGSYQSGDSTPSR